MTRNQFAVLWLARVKFDNNRCFLYFSGPFYSLTHWSRVTHIWVSKLTTIGSDNGLSPAWRQAIIQTNAGILLIDPHKLVPKTCELYLLLYSCAANEPITNHVGVMPRKGFPHYWPFVKRIYRKTSNINHTLVGNEIVDNSDVVGASPVGTAPTTSSFST